jgi:hypothetical protein
VISLPTPCCMDNDYAWFNDECTHMYYWDHCLQQGICKIIVSYLLMNEHTCVTDSTTFTMLHVRSLRKIQWKMYTHMLLITLLTPCCMSDHYVRFNYESAHMFKWYNYLEHVVCQMTMPDLMMNVQTCITDNITYSMLYLRSLRQL